MQTSDAAVSTTAVSQPAPAVQRRVATSAPAGIGAVPSIVHDVLSSPGQPLDTATRAFFEPRFGHDFANVRVHTDAKAAESARAVNALAYTAGNRIVFGAGQSVAPSRLVAHELTHIEQQAASGSASVQRLGDPRSTDAWAFASNTQRFEPWTYEKLLAGVPGERQSLQVEAAETGSLSDDQLQLLVRLTALDLMRQYRSDVIAQRDSLRTTDQSHSVVETKAAARKILELDSKRRILERSRAQLDELAARTNTGGLSPFTQSWDDQVELATREFSNDAIAGARQEFAQWVDAHWEQISDGDRHRGVALLLVLVQARSRQIRGAVDSINDTYRRFPFLAQSYVRDAITEEAEAFVGDPSGDLVSAGASFLKSGAATVDRFDPTGLLAGVRDFAGDNAASAIRSWAGVTVKDFADNTFGVDANYVDAMLRSYDRLIGNIDYAIGIIGSEDIHPFELPAAVDAAGKSLSVDLRKQLETLRKRRELTSLARNLGLSVLEAGLALLPVVGPALAFATSLYSSVTDFESTLDRKALGMAGATPEGTLGVQATSVEVVASGAGVVGSMLEIVDVMPDMPGHIEAPDMSELADPPPRVSISAVTPPASASDLESSVALSSATDSSLLTAQQIRNEAAWVDAHPDAVTGTSPHREASLGESGEHKIVEAGNGKCARHSSDPVEAPCPLLFLQSPPTGVSGVPAANESTLQPVPIGQLDPSSIHADLQTVSVPNFDLPPEGPAFRATVAEPIPRELVARFDEFKQLQGKIAHHIQSIAEYKRELDLLKEARRVVHESARQGNPVAWPLKVGGDEYDSLDEIVQQIEHIDGVQDKSGKLIKGQEGELAAERKALAEARAVPEQVPVWMRDYLRNKSPPPRNRYSSVLQEPALRQSLAQGIDAVFGGAAGQDVSPDHIFPFSRILELDGFSLLSEPEMLMVLNWEPNFVSMRKAANESKGNRSWRDWPQFWNYFPAAATSYEKIRMLERMSALENRMRTELQDLIRTLVKARWGL